MEATEDSFTSVTVTGLSSIAGRVSESMVSLTGGRFISKCLVVRKYFIPDKMENTSLQQTAITESDLTTLKS